VGDRHVAEERARVIFELDEPTLALLFHLMAMQGWTRDRARSVLAKAGWWL
jgi:hypothetical protein